MKKNVQRISSSILANYPINDLVEGWYFKIDEISYGVYLVEGIDNWGRKVSCTGIENEITTMLQECSRRAKTINDQIRKI